MLYTVSSSKAPRFHIAKKSAKFSIVFPYLCAAVHVITSIIIRTDKNIEFIVKQNLLEFHYLMILFSLVFVVGAYFLLILYYSPV